MANSPSPLACRSCKDGVGPPLPFTMAFQPIVDTDGQRLFVYEALVRGPEGQPARTVLGQVTDENRYAFD
jgi:EAL domain-containing protein (putative c-di-GMP-specific phosphodiesterase class I)